MYLHIDDIVLDKKNLRIFQTAGNFHSGTLKLFDHFVGLQTLNLPIGQLKCSRNGVHCVHEQIVRGCRDIVGGW
jgi:hypothetical protein